MLVRNPRPHGDNETAAMVVHNTQVEDHCYVIRPTDWLLIAFAALTALATLSLYVLATMTEQTFAWTVDPPLSAAFLGGGYAAGFLLVVLSRRRRVWAYARIGYLTVLVFTVITLAATILHIDRFHFGSPQVSAQAAAWIWLVVYIVVPVGMVVVLPLQMRAPGTHPARGRPIDLWLRVALTVQGLVMFTAGVGLFFFPAARTVWPWELTPLTARTIAAWLIALAVAAALALAENDLDRLDVPAATYATLGLTQIAAVVRFAEQIDWQRPSAWIYVAMVVSVLAVGLAGLLRIRQTTGRRRRSTTIG